jgi:putative acetyltransferase
MEIKQLKSSSTGVVSVIKEIDNLMNSLYPVEANIFLPIEELDLPNVYFFGIYVEDILAACGALISKFDKENYGEFKRIYVKPKYRGMGLSKSLISHLISTASKQGYKHLRLETGDKQLAAIALYKSFGFEIRNVFGEYVHDPEAVYMELSIEKET